MPMTALYCLITGVAARISRYLPDPLGPAGGPSVVILKAGVRVSLPAQFKSVRGDGVCADSDRVDKILTERVKGVVVWWCKSDHKSCLSFCPSFVSNYNDPVLYGYRGR